MNSKYSKVGSALFKGASISPRKARLVADLINRTENRLALKASAILKYLNTKPKSAALLLKNLTSAISNCEAKGHDLRDLFCHVEVNQGPCYKRIRPCAKGRAARPKKRTSHIKITLFKRTGD